MTIPDAGRGNIASNVLAPGHLILLSKMSNNVVMMGRGRNDEVSLLDILDHVVNSGVVIQGSLVISLAGVDLIYLGLNVVLTAVETALKQLPPQSSGLAAGINKSTGSKRA